MPNQRDNDEKRPQVEIGVTCGLFVALNPGDQAGRESESSMVIISGRESDGQA